jgi:hypothetical protein
MTTLHYGGKIVGWSGSWGSGIATLQFETGPVYADNGPLIRGLDSLFADLTGRGIIGANHTATITPEHAEELGDVYYYLDDFGLTLGGIIPAAHVQANRAALLAEGIEIEGEPEAPAPLKLNVVEIDLRPKGRKADPSTPTETPPAYTRADVAYNRLLNDEPAHLELLSLKNLAEIISLDWGSKVYFGAVPYLQALGTLLNIHDKYGEDPGRDIVAYFLANANSWRGPVARAVKAELKRLLKTAR